MPIQLSQKIKYSSHSLFSGCSPFVSLKPFTTLRAGGHAEWFYTAYSSDQFAWVATQAQARDLSMTVLGLGSNILPSDKGVSGLVIHNRSQHLKIGTDGVVVADTGCGFQELFVKTAQAGLRGLEFGVGIPGTLGGALVSNAGAYRSNISEFLTALEIVYEGKSQWVEPSWMEFSYRNSILRSKNSLPCILLRVKMRLPKGDPKRIYDEAREYQRQRISKQPAPASAGSFFKNIYHYELAQKLDTLPASLKDVGIIPAGYLLMKAGLSGFMQEGAMFSSKHANFMINIGNASAFAIRRLAEYAKKKVAEEFGVQLEEEVLYLGNWSDFN